MNRVKKEEIKKHQQARAGLTPEQVKELDAQEAEYNLIDKIARRRHLTRYPEEYDFMNDSSADASDRRRGINPMSQEYIAKVNKRRKEYGVSPLTVHGYASSNETLEACCQEVKNEIAGLRTRIDEILFYKWDPANISNTNWPRGEYTRYVEEILEKATLGRSASLIDHLAYLRTEMMSLQENKEHDSAVGELIYALVNDYAYYPDHQVVNVD